MFVLYRRGERFSFSVLFKRFFFSSPRVGLYFPTLLLLLLLLLILLLPLLLLLLPLLLLLRTVLTVVRFVRQSTAVAPNLLRLHILLEALACHREQHRF